MGARGDKPGAYDVRPVGFSDPREWNKRQESLGWRGCQWSWRHTSVTTKGKTRHDLGGLDVDTGSDSQTRLRRKTEVTIESIVVLSPDLRAHNKLTVLSIPFRSINPP